MHPHEFAVVARLLAARRLSRRQALAGAVGIAAAGQSSSAAATQAPRGSQRRGFTILAEPAPGAIATPAPADSAKPVMFLFLQSYASGTLAPRPDAAAHYTLTLRRGLGETVYFSDRPQKLVGTVPTPAFLAGLGFTPDNPPNAALIGHRSPTHKDIVVLELFAPRYDPASNTATYDVSLLHDLRKIGESFEQTPDVEKQLPRTFTEAHLFIDDCPDITRCVRQDCKSCPVDLPIPNGPYGTCWRPKDATCTPCDQSTSTLETLCNQTYPECGGACAIA